MRKVVISLSMCVLVVLAGACTLVSNMVHDDEVVARVGKDKLYKSDLEKVIPDMISPEDSTSLAARYINSWAMDRLYSAVAGRELSKAEIDVSEELEEYRISLVKYRYEQRYIADRLDTLVTDEQIADYYGDHQADFVLTRPVLKVRFIDIMRDSKYVSETLRLIRKDDYQSLQQLDTIAKTAALKYFDASDSWMDAAELASEFGLDWKDLMSMQRDDMIKYEPKDRGDVMVAYIYDVVNSGAAPVEYVTPSIRDIIISDRKHELVKGLEQDLLDRALESKEFEIY